MEFINLKIKIKELALIVKVRKVRKENLPLISGKAECTQKRNKFCDKRCSEKCPRVISRDGRRQKACKVVYLFTIKLLMKKDSCKYCTIHQILRGPKFAFY